MIETMKDTSKHKHKTSSEEEEEEEEENLRDKLIKAEEDVKVQGYPQRIRLQRRQYGIDTVCFLSSFSFKSLNKPLNNYIIIWKAEDLWSHRNYCVYRVNSLENLDFWRESMEYRMRSWLDKGFK